MEKQRKKTKETQKIEGSVDEVTDKVYEVLKHELGLL